MRFPAPNPDSWKEYTEAPPLSMRGRAPRVLCSTTLAT